MENSRVGYLEFLVARSDQSSKEICRGVQCLPAKRKLHRIAGRKTYAKFNSGKALDTHISRFHH